MLSLFFYFLQHAINKNIKLYIPTCELLPRATTNLPLCFTFNKYYMRLHDISIYLESVSLKLSFLSFFKICILQNWDHFLQKSYPHVSRIPKWPPLPLNGTLCLFGWPPPCKMQDDLFLTNIFHVKHKMMHTFVNLHKSPHNPPMNPIP